MRAKPVEHGGWAASARLAFNPVNGFNGLGIASVNPDAADAADERADGLAIPHEARCRLAVHGVLDRA